MIPSAPAVADVWRAALAKRVDTGASALLGAALVTGDGLRMTIVEAEAYGGEADDAASHAFRGQTPRNTAMFGPVGRLYVYRSYGIHMCVNIVCHEPDAAGAVLLRAATVDAGEPLARLRRNTSSDLRVLASGPGRLGQALGLTVGANGMDVLEGRSTVQLIGGPGAVPASRIGRGPRVGITREADRPWRFWIEDHPAVTRYRRG